MNDCHEIITTIYSHPAITNLISKIKPESIRDDLHQELAISLLEQPCERVASIMAEQNLIGYAIRTCWRMVTNSKSDFYKKFRQSDIKKAIEYMRAMQPGSTIPISFATTARTILSGKTETIHGDHEARIFNKYIDLGSCRAVARHYEIPVNHVCSVVAKVKKELKCSLYQ